MTNQEIIRNKFEAFLQGVRSGGSAALRAQMEDTLGHSLNAHEALEGGYHTHHLEESDSHGWAVADGGSIVGSGASLLEQPNKYGSAEEDAQREAVRENPGQKGVFSAVMVHPFAGGSVRTEEDKPMLGEPHDSVRFETKIQELLRASAHVNFPRFFRNCVKASLRK